MRILSLPIAAAFLASTALATGACGSSSDGTNPVNTISTGDDGGTGDDGSANGGNDTGAADVAVDTNDPLDPTYPASHAPIPPVDYNGGRVLTTPKIVTVTYDTDTLRARLETFGDTITATPWWDAVRAGYCAPQGGTACVGPGTGGVHVHLPIAGLGQSIADNTDGNPSAVQDLVKQTAAGLATVDDQTLIVIYFPASVSVSLTENGQTSIGCQQGGFGGYHNATSYTPTTDAGAGTAISLPYAIVPRCTDPSGQLSIEQETTLASSHEIAEAATDPDPATLSYYMTSQAGQLWSFAGGEVGDVCVDFTGQGNDQFIESTFTVQRIWSNGSAAASHDPCVPIPSGDVYFNVAPSGDTAELQLAVGASRTIELDAFSDAPMDADWTISVKEFSQLQPGSSPAYLELTPDKTSVHNGSKVHLTVKLLSAIPSQGAGPGYSPYAIISTDSHGKTRFWPAVVVAQ